MICIHTGAKKQRVFFPLRDGPGPDAGMVMPAGRGAVVVRYGCRRFIYTCATLNRNEKNVHAGIDRESFPNHRVDILKILVIPYGCSIFTEKACSGMARAERRCSYWPERDAHPHRLEKAGIRAGRGIFLPWRPYKKMLPGESTGGSGEAGREKNRPGSGRIKTGRGTSLQAKKGHPKEKNKKGTARMAVPQSISPRPGRCCGVCGGAFLLPCPRAGQEWKAVPGCGRAPPGAWPPGATA